MDGLRKLLMDLRQHSHARENFLGLLNVFIGRRIETANAQVLANGLTWREMAELLKRTRWEKSIVRILGVDPATLPPRDRARYWYQCIIQAEVYAEAATKAGDRFAQELEKMGYKVGPSPPQTKGAG
jgi:hypothetical protein